jgi:hypothetical protein
MGIFLFTTAPRTALRPTQPPIQWVPGALSLGVKWPGRKADHSPSSIAEVKNAWSYTSTPQYAFMEWCLVKHRDFTFLPFTHTNISRLIHMLRQLLRVSENRVLRRIFGPKREEVAGSWRRLYNEDL